VRERRVARPRGDPLVFMSRMPEAQAKKPPFDDLPRPCPGCGARFEAWRAGDVDCGRCPSCQTVVVDVSNLEAFAKGVSTLTGSNEGRGTLREGEPCPCGAPLRLTVERAWLVCDSCQRVVLGWSDVLEIARKPELADIEWGMLAVQESDLPLTNWFTDARGRAAFFIIVGLVLLGTGAQMAQRDILITSATPSVADRVAASNWWQLVLDGDVNIVVGVLSVLGGFGTLLLASAGEKRE